METRTVLITGGAGFIGSNFVRHLYQAYPHYRITVLDALTYAGNMENIPDEIKTSDRFTFWYGNVTNSALVSELVSRCDTVVHFAAETHVARSIFDNDLFFKTDVLGTQSIANAVLQHRDTIDRFIHISTSEVYGTALSDPMTEDHPLNPASPYASAKVGADRLVYSYYTTYDIPAVIIRPFNNYGPNQHLEKVIPRFVSSALMDEPLTVHGTGHATRDWLYVGDTCEAIDKAIHVDLHTIRGQVINLGTGHDTSIGTIAEMVLERLGKPSSLLAQMSDRPGQVKRHVSSTERADHLLQWKAQTGFESGLARTIDWYASNHDWWKKLLWMRHVPIKTRDGRIEFH